MPPVLGPVSPSPIRLWSWAIGNAIAVVPSHSAISVHSGPCMRSSSRNGPVAAAAVDRSFGGRVAVGDDDALAAGQPVEFHHDRDADVAATRRRRSAASVKRAKRGPGTPSSVASDRA